jgi:hypothetical protein
MDMLLSAQDANELIIVDGIFRNRVMNFTLGMITYQKIAKFVKQHTLKFKLNAIRRVLTKCKLNLVILFNTTWF